MSSNETQFGGYVLREVNLCDTLLVVGDLEFKIKSVIPYSDPDNEFKIDPDVFLLLSTDPLVDVITAYYNDGILYRLRIEERATTTYVNLVTKTKKL